MLAWVLKKPLLLPGDSSNPSFLQSILLLLRILTGKKHHQIKFQRSRKIWIWKSGWLVHQIKSLYEVLKLKQSFRKMKIVTGKTPIILIDPFCTFQTICLNTGFWQSSFVWKCCVFNFNTFDKKTVI